jgi:predicted negative regulator of RcsB-dependent stress response
MKGTNLSLNARLWLFAGVVLAVIAYMGYNFYETEYVEYSQKVERLDVDIRKKKGELRQILAQKQRLKDLEAEIELANVEFAKLQASYDCDKLVADEGSLF